MRVFISWSGDRSEQVAKKLRDWIPKVIQAVEPWVSGVDIEAGSRWGREVEAKLDESRFGIICLTPSNQGAPWLLFEAGALAKTLDDSLVCPYLIGMKPPDMTEGPLSSFHAKCADKEGTRDLIATINGRLGEKALSDRHLEEAFDIWWPKLKPLLENLPPDIPKIIPHTRAEPGKSSHDLIEKMFDQLEASQRQRVKELLEDAIRLRRSRFMYTNPDSHLKTQMTEFRSKMDLTGREVVDRYTRAASPGPADTAYGEIYLRRGIVAYYEDDAVRSREMLLVAERFFPSSKSGSDDLMKEDTRLATAFTQFYLALIEKNYGDMSKAKGHIEKSYAVRGRKETDELLTPTARAEILSYFEDVESAREAIREILDRASALQQEGPLARHDAIYVLRARLLLGNTYYVKQEWDEALSHYRDALDSDVHLNYKYYLHYSISQVYDRLGDEDKALENRRMAHQTLLESDHMNTKIALDTRILLNALAYRCTCDDADQAQRYKEDALNFILRIHESGGLQLHLFSFEQKRPVDKNEFRREVFGE